MGVVTLKIVQKYEPNAEGKRVVRLRITANRVHRFIALPVEVTAAQFNKKGKRDISNWIRNHPNQETWNRMIEEVWDRAIGAISSLGRQASADEVKAWIEQQETAEITVETKPSQIRFLAYCSEYIVRRGTSATTDTYMDAQKAFSKYLAQSKGAPTDVEFADLTIPFLKNWRSWALSIYKNNTVWVYHSRLKSMFFQALEDVEGLTSLPNVVSDPFRRVKVAKEKTKKNRLYEDEISRLSNLELTWESSHRRARDICLMMYYAHGMRVGDALRLRLRHYVMIETAQGTEHRLIYTMGKTGKSKNVLLPNQCIQLLAPYREACMSPNDTIFSYLRRYKEDMYDEYQMRQKIKSKVVIIRKALREMAEQLGIEKNLSAHVFRHSFADLARRSKMDVMQIQKALGHEQLNTTQGYLEELEESAVDEATKLFT